MPGPESIAGRTLAVLLFQFHRHRIKIREARVPQQSHVVSHFRIRMNPPFLTLPRRPSLPLEAASFLREQIVRGNWPRMLPGEMELARELQVGRNTIRAALAVLEKEGLVRTASGRRREVVGKVKNLRAKGKKIAVILLPEPWHRLPTFSLQWVEALRLRMQMIGWHLQLVVEPTAFGCAPTRALESLLSQHPSAVWLLYRSTVAMQRWFQKQQVMTVVAGSCYAGITLPQVDTDFRAGCRHAAARLLGLGHRSLAVLAPAVSFPGDDESLLGFREGAEGASVQVLPVKDTKASVIQALQSILRSRARPTALFTFEARHAATALTFLAKHRVAVPEQMALVSRNDEEFLTHLVPEPSRYERRPDAFAKKFAHLVTTLSSGIPLGQTKHLIVPSFIRGESLGRAPVP